MPYFSPSVFGRAYPVDNYARRMTNVLAAFHFEVPGLEVEVSALGSEIEAERDGLIFTLRIPATEGEFADGSDDAPQVFAGFVTDSHTGDLLRRTVTMVRVAVELVVPLHAGPLLGSTEEEADIDATRRILEPVADIARGIVADYLDIARLEHGQFWLGRTGSAPRVTWLTTLREVGSGDRVRTGYHDP